MEVQIQYGIIDDTLVSIEEIPLEKNGLRCGCTCPGCGQPLVARLGKKRRRHFSHYQGADCSAEHAQQTALHMLAKEIIEQERKFKFPGLNVSLWDIGWENNYYVPHGLPTSLEYKKATVAACSSVVLEKKVSDFVPDIIIEATGKSCLIEIAVTHFVDEEKQKKINALGLPVVEVDLSSLAGEPISRDVVRKALIEQVDNKLWLFNPLKTKAIEWAKVEYKQLYDAAIKREEAERQKQIKREQEQARREEIREKKRAETELLLEDLFVSENYKYELQLLRSDEKFQAVLQTLHLRKEIGESIPFFLDIPITGEMVFKCDRRIWQASIFDKFIYYRKRTGDTYVPVEMKKIQTCLRKYMDFVPINWDLTYSAVIEIDGESKKFSLLYDVVKRYLDYLCYIGFISRLSYGCASVLRVNSMVPPNKEAAERLKDAIKYVDEFAPNIDEQINEFLYPSWKYPARRKGYR